MSVEDKRLVTVQCSRGRSNKLVNEEPAMRETKRQIKERLQAAGRWQDYLARREQLRQEGRTPRQAREESLRQIESLPPQQPSTTDRSLEPVVASRPPRSCSNPRCFRIGVCICKALAEAQRRASGPETVPPREHG